MKQISYVFFLLLLTSINASAQVRFVKKSWPDLLAAAKAENKDIYIDGYTDWCGWCKVLDKETFSDSAVGAWMNDHYISAKMEMEQEEWGKKLAMKYAVNGFPTALVFNSDGKLLYELGGYSPPRDYLKRLQKAHEGDRDRLKGYSTGFDVAYPPFYLKSKGMSGKVVRPSKEEINAYLKGEENKTAEHAWVIWRGFYYQLNEENKEVFLARSHEFAGLYGKDGVNDIITYFIDNMVDSAAKTRDTVLMSKGMAMADRYLSDPETTKSWYRMHYYKETGAWRSYAGEIRLLMAKAEPPHSASINDFCWTIYQQCGDSAVVKDASAWMKDVVAREPAYMYLDTYAALLYKSGNYAEAREYAHLAIKAGKASGESVEATEKLLGKIPRSK